MINGMTFLKLLLNINLIFFVTITIVAGKNSENNLIFLHPSYIIALHYDIKISLPHSVTNYTFYGESNVNIIVRHPTQRINLHSVFVDMDKSASLFHEISRRVYKASNYTCQYKLFVCTFHFHDLITIGSYIFKMKYHGTITDRENADGFVITSYLDDERKLKWIYSAGGFQNTIGGQYVFPSLNELMFKATFNITVFHPKHFVAISNMPAATRKNINMNTVRVNFQTTPAMHPHLVAIAVSELDALYSDNGNIALWVRDISVVELMHFTLQVIVASTTYLRDKYFQDDKLNDISTTNHVVIPYHRDDGLPNWGIIFYSEKDVVYNEEWNSIERKTEIASLVARKVTHQFLNKITLSSWTDIWLNEGIAMFLGMHVLDKNFTDLQMMNLIIVRNRFETLHLESIINTPPIVLQIEEPYGIKSYSSFRYNKDHVDTFDEPQHSNNIEVTLETLHQCCCNLLCCMGNKPVKIASVNNLWDVMQTALDKSDHENMFDIKEVMNFWITKNQYPVLKVIRNYNNGRTIIWSEMRNTSEQHEWWIPVTYTTQTNLNFSITWPFFQEWITSEKFFINLSLNMNDWIIVNLQQLGYYRVMYDKENWLRLAKHLNSYRYYKIHVLNRAQIIDDAYHFFMMKQLDFEMFKNLTSYLWREKNYVAWYPMFKILRHMFIHSNIFSHPEAEPMKAHMLSIVHNLFEEIGYYNQVYDHIHAISIREEAAEWACFFGDKICRETAYKELQTYMKLAVMHKIPLQKWVACGALMITNSTNTWYQIYNLYTKETDNVLLEYLPCIKEPNVIIEYLKIIRSNVKILDNDYNNIFFSAIAYHANDDIMLSTILMNVEAVKPRNLNFLDIIKRIIKYMYTERQFKMINDYVKSRHGYIFLDVKREIENHISETKYILECFQTNSQSLKFSINFDYGDVVELFKMLGK